MTFLFAFFSLALGVVIGACISIIRHRHDLDEFRQ
jgi:MFS superfamily sulfate permease-like transporter